MSLPVITKQFGVPTILPLAEYEAPGFRACGAMTFGGVVRGLRKTDISFSFYVFFATCYSLLSSVDAVHFLLLRMSCMQIKCLTSLLRLSLYGAFARKLQRNLRPLARMPASFGYSIRLLHASSKRKQKYGLMNKKMHSLYHTTPISITSHPLKLPVNLSEHQVHSTNDSDRVRQEVVPHHKVRSGQVGETGCSDLALVRAVGAVGNEVDTHLTLGGFDSSVRFSGRDSVTFREDLKMKMKDLVKRSYTPHFNAG